MPDKRDNEKRCKIWFHRVALFITFSLIQEKLNNLLTFGCNAAAIPACFVFNRREVLVQGGKSRMCTRM